MEFYRMKAEELPRVNFVDETEISPPYIHRRRKAGEQILYAIKRGEMYLLEDGVPLVLKPGDICILDGARTHEGTRATTCNYYYLHFKHPAMELVRDMSAETAAAQKFLNTQSEMSQGISFYEEYGKSEIWLPKHWHIPNVTDQIRLFELLEQAIREDYSPMENHKILCSCRVQEFFIEIARCFTTAKQEHNTQADLKSLRKVQKIQEWLNRSYAIDISGDLLEKEFSGNFDYMNRVFKKMTGQSIFQYLTRVRMQHAQRLIQQTTMRMSLIGEKTGYPNEYYFSKAFKKYVGMSPTAYAASLSKRKP